MDKASGVDAAYDPNLNARLMFALVSSYPFDLMDVFPKLMKFFTDFFARYMYVHLLLLSLLIFGRNGNKISSYLFSAVNHLLLSCGPNVGRKELGLLYPPFHKFALANATTTHIQLKEQIFVFWRILLRLDVDFAGISRHSAMVI